MQSTNDLDFKNVVNLNVESHIECVLRRHD
jgi:hypothetical protein